MISKNNSLLQFLLDTREGSMGSHPQICPVHPRQIVVALSTGVGGCQVIIQKARQKAIMGNVFGECHAPCTLKTNIVDIAKRVGRYSLIFRAYQTVHMVAVAVKSR
jgi:hypothetical protein